MNKKIAILGLGLIGGSIAAAYRAFEIKNAGFPDPAAKSRIVGYSLNDGEQALRLGLIDELASSAIDAARNADILIFATPPSTIPELLDQCIAVISDDGFAIDVGSTKQSIHRIAQQMAEAKACLFVPCHPIAGSDESGPQAANAALFTGARVVITPLLRNSLLTIERARQFWESLGAVPEIMGADAHDQRYALVSHLPHWVAFSLAHVLATNPDSESLRLAGGAGLRDTTRIAASHAGLWVDIGLENREFLLQALSSYQSSLDQMKRALEEQNKAALLDIMQTASQWRRG